MYKITGSVCNRKAPFKSEINYEDVLFLCEKKIFIHNHTFFN